VVAPEPLKVTDDPEHTVEDGEAMAPTANCELTVSVMVPVLVHPFAPVPVTV
jgi:hypothetical protein